MYVLNYDELAIITHELSIYNEELSITNDEFCIQNDEFTGPYREHRVEACVILFARCIDGQNFVSVKSLLTAFEIAEVTHRLGALNMMNPYNPDGPYVLGIISSHTTHTHTHTHTPQL